MRRTGSVDAHIPLRVARERYVDPSGYVRINRNGGYAFEHRLVMEAHIGRPLLGDETIHHKNGLRADNRVENLEIWTGNHSSGQRSEDLVAFAIEILSRYQPELLANDLTPAKGT